MLKAACFVVPMGVELCCHRLISLSVTHTVQIYDAVFKFFFGTYVRTYFGTRSPKYVPYILRHRATRCSGAVDGKKLLSATYVRSTYFHSFLLVVVLIDYPPAVLIHSEPSLRLEYAQSTHPPVHFRRSHAQPAALCVVLSGTVGTPQHTTQLSSAARRWSLLMLVPQRRDGSVSDDATDAYSLLPAAVLG